MGPEEFKGAEEMLMMVVGALSLYSQWVSAYTAGWLQDSLAPYRRWATTAHGAHDADTAGWTSTVKHASECAQKHLGSPSPQMHDLHTILNLATGQNAQRAIKGRRRGRPALKACSQRHARPSHSPLSPPTLSPFSRGGDIPCWKINKVLSDVTIRSLINKHYQRLEFWISLGRRAIEFGIERNYKSFLIVKGKRMLPNRWIRRKSK